MRTKIPKRDASLPISTVPSGTSAAPSPALKDKPLPPLPPEAMPGRRGRGKASMPSAPATQRRPLMGGLFSRGTKTPPPEPALAESIEKMMVDETLSSARSKLEELFTPEQFSTIDGWLADRETNSDALDEAGQGNGLFRRMTTALGSGSALSKCPNALSDAQKTAARELADYMDFQVVKDNLRSLGDGRNIDAVDPRLVKEQLQEATKRLRALTHA